ncbi:MAG: hypothetical protein ABIM89_17180, partial [Mycobacteriales bacterium]
MPLITVAHPAATDTQLLFAGFAVLVSAQQLLYARSRRDKTATWLCSATASMALVLTSNVAVLRLSDRRQFETALFTRATALSCFAVASIFLCAALSDRRPRPSIAAAAIALATLRIVLWPTTTWMYLHRLADGGPLYGPLLPLLSLPLFAICFGYLVAVVLRSGNNVELAALLISAAPTLAVVAASFLVTDPG